MALSVLAQKNNQMTQRQLAKQLGVTPQRANQLTDSLKSNSFVRLEVSSEDARTKIVSLTTAGAAKLSELNTQLRPLVSAAVRDRPNTLRRMGSLLAKNLMPITIPPGADSTKHRGS